MLDREAREAILAEHHPDMTTLAMREYKRPPQGPSRRDLGLPDDTPWKRLLVEAPFDIRKWFEITLRYHDAEIRSVKISRIVEGPHDYYLRAFSFLRQNARTLSVSAIGALITEDGLGFDHGPEWINSLPLRTPKFGRS